METEAEIQPIKDEMMQLHRCLKISLCVSGEKRWQNFSEQFCSSMMSGSFISRGLHAEKKVETCTCKLNVCILKEKHWSKDVFIWQHFHSDREPCVHAVLQHNEKYITTPQSWLTQTLMLWCSQLCQYIMWLHTILNNPMNIITINEPRALIWRMVGLTI